MRLLTKLALSNKKLNSNHLNPYSVLIYMSNIIGYNFRFKDIDL